MMENADFETSCRSCSTRIVFQTDELFGDVPTFLCVECALADVNNAKPSEHTFTREVTTTFRRNAETQVTRVIVRGDIGPTSPAFADFIREAAKAFARGDSLAILPEDQAKQLEGRAKVLHSRLPQG